MATAIEWTDETWNPLAGCREVSPGCANCYAAGMAYRLAAMAEADIAAGRDPGRKRHYIGLTEKRGGKIVWTGKINLITEALGDPLTWKKPRRVFVNSMSDLFHESVPLSHVADVFGAMALSPEHTFQVLTKRPDRMAEFCNTVNVRDLLYDGMERVAERAGIADFLYNDQWPLPNVWLGTSVENQQQADTRIPHLLKCPAAVRFLSCEPLLGPVKLPFTELAKSGVLRSGEEIRQLHWVIVGGESGHNARPMHPDWARSLRDQCQAASVPFFFKHWGEWAPYHTHDYYPESKPLTCMKVNGETSWVSGDVSDGILSNCSTNYEDTDKAIERVGKHAAGRLLDGRPWDEFPEVPVCRSERVIAEFPPADGQNWECQCARCGASCYFVDCDNCDEDGMIDHDCGEDCCCCLDPEPNVPCSICWGHGGWYCCLSSGPWCQANPLPGRKAFERGKIEWFVVPEVQHG
jgi:protein gp37